VFRDEGLQTSVERREKREQLVRDEVQETRVERRGTRDRTFEARD
jgi:hypothetical protein